jgi:hypothetical protein
MKLILIIVAVSIFTNSLFSQIDSRRGYEYLAEFADTNMLYTDIVCSNYDNDPWCAVGQNRTEKAIHYSSDNRSGANLKMISVHKDISAVSYSEFYIYNEFQELTHYVYKNDQTELKCKIVGNTVSIISYAGKEMFAENYFLNEPETYFEYLSIKARSDKEFDACTSLLDLPNFEKEILKIRDDFNKTNLNKGYKQVIHENATFYYDGDEIVKIVVKDEVTMEFYVDNSNLYFAYYSASADTKEIRYYIKSYYPFRILLGKEKLSIDSNEFWEIADEVQTDFERYLELSK